METEERKLVTIRKIDNIEPIPDADKIEKLTIDGWQLVSGKGNFQIGDPCVYFEVDSFIPESLIQTNMQFLEKDIITWKGMKGARIRTIKLRGQISAGLAVPINDFHLNLCNVGEHAWQPIVENFTDLTEALGVLKWEREYAANGARMGAGGAFPSFIKKTNQERIQNIYKYIQRGVWGYAPDDMYEVSEKLDGCHQYKSYLNIFGGGSVQIGKVVNEKLNPILLGKDNDGSIVPSFIKKWYKNDIKENWLKITLDLEPTKKRHNKKFLITSNHIVWINDIEQPIKNAKIGDKVISYIYSPSKSVIHLIKSGLLGDGSLSQLNKKYVYSDGHIQKKYSSFINKWLGECASKTNIAISGFGSKIYRVASKQYGYFFKKIRNEWYSNGKKVVPEDLSWMDDFSIAKWYMDDGSLAHSDKQKDRAVFATNGFEEEDVKRLANKLEELYNINTTVYFSKGWIIRINSGDFSGKDINTFWKAIAPHIVDCMRYKLPEEYRSVEYIEYENGEEIIKQINGTILKIEILNEKKIGYDIETTTGNYFCNGILVHNSSMTTFFNTETFGVCSHNFLIKKEEAVEQTMRSIFWRLAEKNDIEAKLKKLGRNIAIQGEAVGPGIQKNRLQLKELEFYVYDIWDIDNSCYLPAQERLELCHELDLLHVPVLEYRPCTFENAFIAVEYAKGISLLNKDIKREGTVWKSLRNPDASFKIINNDYLLKYSD